jgi:hypothetical protein
MSGDAPAAARRALARARARTSSRIRPRLPRSPSGGKRPVAVVYGNCTAEPLRTLLADSLTFAERYRTEPLPAAHVIGSAEAAAQVRRTVAEAQLIIYQPVRENYRGLPLGSAQITADASSTARRLTVPALYYDGVFPYQAYVRATDNSREEIPRLSGYHDLRFLFCAAEGLKHDEAQTWFRDFRGSPDGLRAWAVNAQRRVRAYEASLDIAVTDRLFSAALHHRSFFTADHPTNAALVELAARIHAALGLDYDPVVPRHALLGHYRAPLDGDVVDALTLPTDPGIDWVVNDRRYPREQLLAEHLAFYAEHPESVAAGMAEHGHRMDMLGIPVS